MTEGIEDGSIRSCIQESSEGVRLEMVGKRYLLEVMKSAQSFITPDLAEAKAGQ